jgi:perosamine synthetase
MVPRAKAGGGRDSTSVDGVRQVPLCVPDVGERELRAVAEVFRSGWLAHGPANQEFERRFGEYLGVPHCVSLNSCASALHLALKAAGVGGEVILPSFTFVASANAVVNAGAQCVFAEVEYETCNLSPAAVEAALTPRTEALMPVHFAGLAAELKTLSAIAERRGLLLLEDSAEAIGAAASGPESAGKGTAWKKTGAWGVGCFSFYPTKNLTTGEGGMVATRDAALAEKVRCLAGHGVPSSAHSRERQSQPWLRAATHAGYNFRMSNVNAAIGAAQLERLDEMNAARRRRAAQYAALLDPEVFDLPAEPPGYFHVWQMYTAKLKAGDRAKFLAQLRSQGIGATVHFDPPVHRQPYYAELLRARKLDLPVTERLAARIFTLPMYPRMTEEDTAYVARAANRAARDCRS